MKFPKIMILPKIVANRRKPCDDLSKILLQTLQNPANRGFRTISAKGVRCSSLELSKIANLPKITVNRRKNAKIVCFGTFLTNSSKETRKIHMADIVDPIGVIPVNPPKYLGGGTYKIMYPPPDILVRKLMLQIYTCAGSKVSCIPG